MSATDGNRIAFMPARDLTCARCGACPPYPHKGTCDYSLARSGAHFIAGVDDSTPMDEFEKLVQLGEET